MGHHNSMSESIEMYLLRIALLQETEEPVPVPKLAQELSVSPVSANEMCRKLTEKALITYEPYKGVRLTAQGEALARRVLRHRRLWEVFFVDNLGIEPLEAEEMACRFEHVTPDTLAEHLADFLGHPTYSPQHQPIPVGENQPAAELTGQPLTSLAAGLDGCLSSADVDVMTQEFLYHQGLVPGAAVTVLAVGADGSLLLQVQDRRLSLAGPVAAAIRVTDVHSTGSKPEPIYLENLYPQETAHVRN